MRTINQDVNTLGRALGTVLKEQQGERFFELVEKVRTRSIELREKGEDTGELQGFFKDLNLLDAEALVRAFSMYFQLINLAEEYERVRKIENTEGPHKQSLEQAFVALKEQGMKAEDVIALVEGLHLGLTFTAHPTEMRRRTVRYHLDKIARDLPRLDDVQAQERVTAHVESLWGTLELRHVRPTVRDEVKGGLNYIEVIGAVLPALEEEFRSAFERVYGKQAKLRVPYHFYSWMGGDRDGNPFVTPEVTRETLALHAARAREMLRGEIREAFSALSHHQTRVEAPRDFTAEEPWREVLQAMHNDENVRGDQVLDHIKHLEKALEQSFQKRSARTFLQPLITRTRTFGTHLVSLDIREHSGKTGAAVAELFTYAGVPNYLDLPEEAKVNVLRKELQTRRPLLPAEATPSDDLESVLGPLRAIREALGKYGQESFGRYIVSMSESVSDFLEVLILAREIGVRVLPVPLFETLEDLTNAPVIMKEVLSNPEYRKILADDVQEIMLGYSDSNKDAGFLAANWALHEAQRQISDVCREAGVPWRFFHGRGTSIGRGGGPMARAILGQPAGTIGTGLRITEQGEALADKYSHPKIAFRNLEQGMYGLLLSAAKPVGDLPEKWVNAMRTASKVSQKTYRELVEHPDFLEFFELVTPIREIARLNIASRPVRRPGPATLHNLRAIPWVMAWTQNRANVPGWYGLLEGLKAMDLDVARDMYQNWQFFRSVLDNAQMSLAKSDMQVFRAYLSLAPHLPELGQKIQQAYEEAVDLIKQVVQGEVLDNEPNLRKSILLRNPYIEPIHRLQVELLKRFRTLPPESMEGSPLERSLLLSIQGIAAGVRNTG